jgi:hypothetical protein
LGTAKIITGDGHDHRAIWRVNQIAPARRYSMDDATGIAQMKNRGFTKAREQLPELGRLFFDRSRVLRAVPPTVTDQDRIPKNC